MQHEKPLEWSCYQIDMLQERQQGPPEISLAIVITNSSSASSSDKEVWGTLESQAGSIVKVGPDYCNTWRASHKRSSAWPGLETSCAVLYSTVHYRFAMSKVFNVSDDFGKLLLEGWVCDQARLSTFESFS
jgi:hypothetical protein